jgi:hypothetical protein
MNKYVKTLLATVAISLAALTPAALASSHATAAKLPAKYKVFPLHGFNPAKINAPAAAGYTVPLWNSSVVSPVDGHSYSYYMVGKSPLTAQNYPAAIVPAPIVPLVFKFPNGGPTFDPTKPDASCGQSQSALARTLASPIFNNLTYVAGATSLGSAQYVDAFQRASFWKYTKPTGVNPKYHVKLATITENAITISVPAADAALYGTGCKLGEVDINWLYPYLKTTVFPKLVAAGIDPTSFPNFLVYNVVQYDGNVNNCCILGYHDSFNDAHGNPQTYAISNYDGTPYFGGSSTDIATLSHEVAEWMDDPFGNNATPAWGHVGQVSGCQDNLEVGDPLSGTKVPIAVNGFTYHPQDLAFFSWFYRQNPSWGVNGWFSFAHTFSTGAGPVCS